MAEDQGEKEEQKFEFDSAGEAVGYISLEQARVLAIRHARDNTDFYGPAYSGVNLVSEVVSQEEGEDYYDIRLSFRPAGRFRGEPGLEQFIIDKTGDIQVRQILDEPSTLAGPARRRPPVLLMSAVGLVVIVAVAVVGAFVSGAFGDGKSEPATLTSSPAAALQPTDTPILATPTPIVIEKEVPVTVVAAPAPAAKEVIKFHNPGWETIQEHNAIATYIVEKGYGYPVEIIPGDTGTMKVTLPAGEIDVNMELWQANIPDWYDDVIAKGTVVDLTGTKGLVANGAVGQIIESTDQGWYVPTFVIEANPGLKSVSDLPNFIELFRDPEDSSKGLWYSCTPGAACTKRFIAKADAYGLDQTYNVLTPGSYGALAAAIEGAYLAGEPVLAYYWEPTALLAELDMTQLEEPPWSQECADALAAGTEAEPYESDIGCHDAFNDVHTGVTASLVNRAPEVVDFLGKMFIGALPLADLAGWKNDNNKDWDEAAVYYLKNNEKIWTQWVPADVAAKVKEALVREPIPETSAAPTPTSSPAAALQPTDTPIPATAILATPVPTIAPIVIEKEVPVTVVAAPAPAAKEVIKFHEGRWETLWEHNAIAMYITENGYGYPVEQITGTTGTMKVALPAGDLDVNMEMWRQNQLDWYAENIANGTLVHLAGTGDNLENGAVGQALETLLHGIVRAYLRDREEPWTDVGAGPARLHRAIPGPGGPHHGGRHQLHHRLAVSEDDPGQVVRLRPVRYFQSRGAQRARRHERQHSRGVHRRRARGLLLLGAHQADHRL